MPELKLKTLDELYEICVKWLRVKAAGQGMHFSPVDIDNYLVSDFGMLLPASAKLKLYWALAETLCPNLKPDHTRWSYEQISLAMSITTLTDLMCLTDEGFRFASEIDMVMFSLALPGTS